jgi:hypothetical protein
MPDYLTTQSRMMFHAYYDDIVASQHRNMLDHHVFSNPYYHTSQPLQPRQIVCSAIGASHDNGVVPV